MARDKEYRIKVDAAKVRKGVRDLRIADMISTPGGVTRVFQDKKRQEKTDKSKRHVKHKKRIED